MVKKYSYIPTRLKNAAENDYVAGAEDILDDALNKTQEEINGIVLTPSTGIDDRLKTIEQGVTFEGTIQTETNPANVTSGSAKVPTGNAVRGAIDVRTGYFKCTTVGGTAEKAVTAAGYVLSRGGGMRIWMEHTNTADNATLNINSTGAKALFYNGERAGSGNTWEDGETITVYYDETANSNAGAYFASNAQGGNAGKKKLSGHNGYAINLGVGIGNTVGSEAVDQYSTGTEIKVSEGDVILVTAQGGNNSRAWGFIDGNRVLLSVADATKFYEDEVLIAPAGADKIVLNAVILDTPGGIIGYPNYEWYFAKADSVGADAMLAKSAKYIKYDNSQSRLAAENVQGALDEIHGETVLTNNTGFNPLNESQYNANLTNIRITVANEGFTAEVISRKSTSTADYVAGITCTSLKAGKTYEIEFDYVSGWSGSFQIRDASFNTDGNIFGVHTAGTGHISIVKTLTSDSGSFTFLLPQNTAVGQTLVISNLVITEVTSLKDKVDDIDAELNDNLKHQITPVVGSYYKLDVEIGSVADTIVDNDAWQYARIPVEEGDVICITGNSGEIPRLWGYLGSNYTLLDVARASETGNKLVKVVPSGVSYVVVNSTVNSHPQWYYAKAGSAGADELLAYRTQQKLDAIYEGVDISEQFVFTDNAGIATDTTPPGQYATNSRFTLWKATQGFVDISQYNYILVTVPNIYNSPLGIAFYSEASEATCVYAEASTLEGAGRIKVKSYDVSSYNYMRLTFTQGNDKFSCIASIRQNYQSAGKNANEILVAASDAPSDIKAQADFVCTGSHDEVTIQNAIDAFVTGKKSCIRLSKGIFNIDAFPNYLATDEGDTYTAIALPNTGTLPEIRIFGSGNRAGGGSTTRLNITQTAHSTIVSNTQYKVIGGKSFQYSYGSSCCVLLSDFDIYLNSNQYPILGIDMSLVNRVKIDRIFMMATTAGKLVSQPRPVEGCIGLRMTSGSNWGTENDYRNVSVYGFYEGFQVGGESVLCENLCSINAVYGYTFGNYPWQDSFNHKIVMIGIADERTENLPLFAESGYASSPGNANNTPFEVVLLGYSTEFIAPVWSNNAINYATESHPNGYCGVITYTHETGVRANQVNIPFWAEGMGKNFKTSNSAQLEVTTKSVLKTYAPNYNQIVYCTDLQKPLICTEPSTKEWRDFMGNVVDINS